MIPLLLDRLSRTVSRASGLVYAIVLETAAHGTVRTTGAFTRIELVQERGGGKIDMFDASDVALIKESDAPDTAADDVVLVDGRLFHVRKPLADGAGGLKISMKDAQRLGATWGSGGTGRIGLFLAGGLSPGGETDLDVGATTAAVVAADECLGLVPGAVLAAIDGMDLRVDAIAAWTPGWARLALTRTA